jgi:adenylate cyclase
MESHGLPGNININHETYLKVKDKYPFKSIGKIFIKGKGSMEIYVLKNSFEELS